MKQMLWLGLCAGLFPWLAGCSKSSAQPNAPSAAPAPLAVMARVHFAGAAAVAADPNSIAFSNLWRSAPARALREQTLDKLAQAPYEWFKSKLPPRMTNEAPRFRPLLDDLLQAEWFWQLRDATNGSPEFVLAIRLEPGRVRLWSTNLAVVLQKWTDLKIRLDPAGGWELKKHLPPDLFRFVHVGDWVVLGCGQDELPLTEAVIRRVRADQRPGPRETNDWLTAEADWARLAPWLSLTNFPDLPDARLQVVGRDGDLHLSARLVFPQPLAMTLDPWQLPTNLIREPLVSFEAVRGVRPWLDKCARLRALISGPLPDQLFMWALGQIPFQTYVAAPVTNAARDLRELHQTLAASYNPRLQHHRLGSLQLTTNQDAIVWKGVPFAAPYLQAVAGPGGQFLFAGLFPNSPRPQPLPPGLFAPLERSNVVFYQWENTSERLKGLPQLTQLALLLTHHRQLGKNSAAAQWLNYIGPNLSNTVTEITRTAPSELTIHRRASAGLTAMELTALANWLEAPNFPGCDLHLPPSRFYPGQAPAKSPAVPVPASRASH